MRIWKRAAAALVCGGCGQRIAAEDPVLAITFSEWVEATGGQVHRQTAVKLRCVACAGPAPPDLPARPVMAQITKPMARPTWSGRSTGRTAAALAVAPDYKQAQYEREPGCDDD